MNLRYLWRDHTARTLLALPVFALLFIGLCILSVPYLIAQTHGESWCAPGAPRYAPHGITGETCPIVGSMGGVKLAIPQHYLMGPTTYKGVDIWNAKSWENRPKHPTFENEFDNFAIKIRLNNFKAIETAKDFDDFLKKDKTLQIQPFENRWIDVSFEARTFRNVPVPEINFKSTVRNWLIDESHWGPFERSPDIWGLQHYISVQQPSTGIDWQHEFFYDAKTQASFITCQNTLAAYPPHKLLTFCEIEFVMPEIRALVNAGTIQDKNDLARWREIETGIREVAHSFIVP